MGHAKIALIEYKKQTTGRVLSFERLGPHDVRHTYASVLDADGARVPDPTKIRGYGARAERFRKSLIRDKITFEEATVRPGFFPEYPDTPVTTFTWADGQL